MSKDIDEIRSALLNYQDALNASDTDKLMALYTPDCVFMPPHCTASVGTEAVRTTYNQVVWAIRLHIRFNIEEIVPTNANWAFARTTSAGGSTIKADGGGAEANQDLFLFQKIGGEWKITRHCFCTTDPPK